MIMIVVMHTLRHGGILKSLRVGSWEYWILWGIESLSFVGVNCYLLLTGYFQVKGQFRWRKVISLVVQLVFYCALSAAILVTITGELKLKDLLAVVDPIGNNVYWFAAQYIILYMVSPYINKLLKSLSQEEHKRMCILLFILWGIYPTIAIWAKTSFGFGNNLAWFITVYVVAAYLRMYGIRLSMRASIMGYMGCTAVLLLSRFVLDKVGILIHNESDIGKLLFYNNSPIVFASSIFVFLAFRQINDQRLLFKRSINRIASMCFGVYLIHDSELLRTEFWNHIQIDTQVGKGLFAILTQMIVVVGAIFICGCGIELIRKTISDSIVRLIQARRAR